MRNGGALDARTTSVRFRCLEGNQTNYKRQDAREYLRLHIEGADGFLHIVYGVQQDADFSVSCHKSSPSTRNYRCILFVISSDIVRILAQAAAILVFAPVHRKDLGQHPVQVVASDRGERRIPGSRCVQH